MESQDTSILLIDPTIPTLSLFIAYGTLSFYEVDLPDDNYKITSLSPSMARVINNIRNFSCTFENMRRQVKNYFSDFKTIFIYELLTNILDINFRLEVSIELLEIICPDSVFPYLFYSLMLLDVSEKELNPNKIMFIELLQMKNLISYKEYSIIIKFISENIITDNSLNDNCINYLLPKKLNENNDNEEIFFCNESNSISFNDQSFQSSKEDQIETEKLDDQIETEIEDDKIKTESDDEDDFEYDEDTEIFQNIKDEMILFKRGFKGNRYSPETKQFSLLLMYSSRYSYYLIRNLFALPCEKILDKFASPTLDLINESIFDLDKIYTMLEIQHIDFKDIEQCNISVDAAVFSPVIGSIIKKKYEFLKDKLDDNKIYSSIFTFIIEPLNTNLHSFPVHVIIKEDGFADEQIGFIRNEIIKKLTIKNMNFGFMSSDGDKYFDHDHEAAFKKYEALLESGAKFDELVSVVGESIKVSPWPISDPFHLVKRVRVNCLSDGIGISLLEKFDPKEFENFVTSKSCIRDTSSLGSMKDSYPLTLFGFESFIGSKNYRQSHFLICPLYLFLEGLRNSRLKKKIRRLYFQTAFLFFNYYLHSIGFIKSIATRMLLIRMLNTILGICYCIDNYDFNLSHLGTHPVECYFGCLRILCHYNHTLFNIIHSIGKSVISNNIMDELGIKKKVYGRKRTSGALVIENENNIGYFPFTPDDFFLYCLKVLYNLPLNQTEFDNYEKWIKYICDNHSDSDDSDIYDQGKFAGTNIFSRNVIASKKCGKNKNHEIKAQKISRGFFKNSYLKKYPNEMNEMIRIHLHKVITKIGNNSCEIMNKIFGYIVNKKQYIPKSSDNETFLIPNVFMKYQQFKKLLKQKFQQNNQSLLQISNNPLVNTNKQYFPTPQMPNPASSIKIFNFSNTINSSFENEQQIYYISPPNSIQRISLKASIPSESSDHL